MSEPSVDELRDAIDPEALLEGEDPESPYLEDAVHWIQVYTELVSLKDELLARVDALASGMTDDAVDAADIDRRLLEAEADRFRRRLVFWQRRARDDTDRELASS